MRVGSPGFRPGWGGDRDTSSPVSPRGRVPVVAFV